MEKIRHVVTADDLRHLATRDSRSLFRDASVLVDCDEGITTLPPQIVADTILGKKSKLTFLRVLYYRSQFADDGIRCGKSPRRIDGGDLDEQLEEIAAALNERSTDHSS